MPFHGKATRGWVLGPSDERPARILPVRKVVSAVRFFSPALLDLYRWMASRYVAPLASVIDRSYPPRVASEEGSRDEAAAVGATRGHPRSESALGRYRGGRELVGALAQGHGAFLVRPAPEDEQTLAVEAVGACLAGGRTAVVIVPEAQPLPATAAAVREAFSGQAAMFLGGDKRARYRMWLDILGGAYRVVVGTRPAVFAPLDRLGLIWISRESHPGHREERSPYFHVRDVAIERARVEGAVSVLSALCPSAEATLSGATPVAASGRAWPPVEVVKPGPGGRAPRLVVALKEARRAFVFEPLPGYGVARVCRACGEPAACAACGGVIRQEGGSFACAVCQAEGRCARCGAVDFGVVPHGAERVGEWAARLAPAARIRVGGADHVKDVPPPALDLVAILDADLAARRPGLTARERALAVWMEAAGWARPNGRVIVQASHPNDAAVQALVTGNPDRFYRTELPRREAAGFPAGCPVFRVAGDESLPRELELLGPVSLLSTGGGSETICLLTVRPQALAATGAALRRLAERGTVTRVEAEPPL